MDGPLARRAYGGRGGSCAAEALRIPTAANGPDGLESLESLEGLKGLEGLEGLEGAVVPRRTATA